MVKAHLIPTDINLLPPAGRRARFLALSIFVLAPLFFGALAVALGQDANWDLRNYHWYNAYAFLNDRYGIDLLPSQTPYFYNPTLDVPFYLLARHVPAVVAAFVLGAVQGLNFILLFMIGHVSLIISNPRRKVIICTLLAALGMLGGGGIAQIGVTFYDNITSLGILFSTLLALSKINDLVNGSARRATILSMLFGFPSGLMMGLKLPSVIFCVGLCFAFLFVAGTLRRRVLISFMFGVGILVGIAVSLGHWAWFLQTNFGSPLFPYFNEFFKSPLAPLTSARDTQFLPGTLTDKLFFPFIFAHNPLRVGEIQWRDLRLPILYALLPIAIILKLLFGRTAARYGRIAEPLAVRYLLWSAVISYVVWLLMFAIYRYAIPLEMIAPLLIVFAVGMLPLRAQTRNLLAVFILVFIAITIQPGNWTRKDKWLDHTVEITRPELPDTSEIMIIMAGFEPYSHVVSEFPPSIPFVRIQSNFASPDEKKGINKLIEERISAHKGRFMLLVPAYQNEMAKTAMEYFNLTLLPQTCQKVTDRLFDTNLNLCDVSRTTQTVKHD